ncbi:MAG: acyl-protein synthetase [Deltaproteobacteria bacterium]|nr:MAG: acyl-protein synthetase [Deltaproteobacteria bacterium]
MTRPQFRLSAADKAAAMRAGLNRLVRHHRRHCPAYARLLDVFHPGFDHAERLADLPFLPVGLFRTHTLCSVPPSRAYRRLRSSGTTGGGRSEVVLDRATARLQARALAAVMTTLLGPRRRPMLIVDHEGLLRGGEADSARAAGILGMMTFGRDHLFVLDDDLALRWEPLQRWLDAHRDEPVLVFGFTFLLWRYLLQRLQAAGRSLRLSDAIVVHGGGWKKLIAEAVDRPTLHEVARSTLGRVRVHDFYGMVEQTGSVFLEGPDGLLHAPDFAEVIVREPGSWRPLPPGEPGVIQVLSLVPHSYPGHSLLTEDIGVVHDAAPTADGAWGGRRLQVLGRVPRAVLRGCSDTHQEAG